MPASENPILISEKQMHSHMHSMVPKNFRLNYWNLGEDKYVDLNILFISSTA